MLPRSWIAILLLVNYLLVVGAGCVTRPEDQHELVLVQTSADGYRYQQCRYLRMDGLEAFLNEALANRYQNRNVPDQTRHHLLVVVSGVDAHCLSQPNCPPVSPLSCREMLPVISCHAVVLPGVYPPVYTPPWVG